MQSCMRLSQHVWRTGGDIVCPWNNSAETEVQHSCWSSSRQYAAAADVTATVACVTNRMADELGLPNGGYGCVACQGTYSARTRSALVLVIYQSVAIQVPWSVQRLCGNYSGCAGGTGHHVPLHSCWPGKDSHGSNLCCTNLPAFSFLAVLFYPLKYALLCRTVAA